LARKNFKLQFHTPNATFYQKRYNIFPLTFPSACFLTHNILSLAAEIFSIFNLKEAERGLKIIYKHRYNKVCGAYLFLLIVKVAVFAGRCHMTLS
jgi:hypothetical protein